MNIRYNHDENIIEIDKFRELAAFCGSFLQNLGKSEHIKIKSAKIATNFDFLK
jgi:hypothetical protein